MKMKNKIFLHIIGAVCACLLSCIVVFLTKYMLEDPVPSMYYEDQAMPEDSKSALDMATLRAVNSRLEDLHVYAGPEDAQLILAFDNGEAVEVRSVNVVLEESFSYDVDCALYYPDSSGSYVKDGYIPFTLSKGETNIYFEIPDDVQYSMEQLRVDIDEDYTIKDILVSDKEIIKEYSTREYLSAYSVIIYFFVLFLIFEVCLYFWPRVLRGAEKYWQMRKKIAALALILIGAAVAANAVVYPMFRLIGKEFSWFWGLAISLCSMIAAYEIYLLWRKEPKLVPVKRGKDTGRVRALFWGSILVFVLLIAFEWIDGAENAPELAGLIRFQFPFVFAAVESVLLALLYRKYVLNAQENSISFLNIYIFVFLLLGVAYMLVFLPFVSPDEPSHYLSSYRVANLFLGKIGQIGDDRLLMRIEDYNLYDQHQVALNAEYYMQVTENMRLFAGESGYIVVDAPMVTNAIFSYFTTGLGIAVARVFHLSGTLTFLAGRFGNLLFFAIVLRYLMKKIPFGRTALFAIAMMPMTLHMAASYSYDVMTFCFAALFVTQVMCMICSPEKISRRDFKLCVIYGILMAPSKMVYVPLLFLVLLVPWDKLDDCKKNAWKKQVFVIGAGIAAALLITLIVNLLSADSSIRKVLEENNTVTLLPWIDEQGYTISWVLGHMGEYILMCVRTLILMTDSYFFTMIGSKLGWLDVNLPQVYAVISFVIFLLAVNIRDDVSAHIQIGLGKKIWITVLGAGTVLCTMLIMTVSWTPVSYNYITGVQGRYFIPLLIPIIWLLRNNMIEVNSAIRKHIVFFSTMLNVWILVYVFAQCIVRV